MKKEIWMFRSQEWIKENPNKGTMYKVIVDCDAELTPPDTAVKSVRDYIKKKDLKVEAGVYAICCDIEKKVYIGQSVNMDSRLRQHKYQLSKKENNSSISAYTEMIADIKKYGINSFSFSKLEVIENPTNKILLDRESEVMQLYLQKGYYLYNNYVPLSNDIVYCPKRFQKKVKEFINSLINQDCQVSQKNV